MSEYCIGLYEKAMPENLSIKEKLQCAKSANYDYMELSIDASEAKINRIYFSNEERLELAKAICDTGVKIDSFCVSALTKYALGDLDETNSARGLEIAKGAIKLAYDIGTRIVMIPGYDIYFGTSTKDSRLKFIENTKQVATYAAKYGVIVAFETMENEFMNTVEKAMEYINLVNSPNLQIYPDCGNTTNAATLHGTDVCADLKKGAGHIIALHLKETLPGKFREIPYGTGHVNFDKIVSTAWEIGVRKYVTELWCTNENTWLDDINFANSKMRAILNSFCNNN